MARPKKYPDELVQRGVRIALEGERPIAQIARDLGMHPETLRKKVRQAEADSGRRPELAPKRSSAAARRRVERPLRGRAVCPAHATACHWRTVEKYARPGARNRYRRALEQSAIGLRGRRGSGLHRLAGRARRRQDRTHCCMELGCGFSAAPNAS